MVSRRSFFLPLPSGLVVALALVLSTVAFAAPPVVPGVASLDAVDTLDFAALDHRALLARDAASPPDTPPRWAEPLDVSVAPTDWGTWETVAGAAAGDDLAVWRLRVRAPQALSLAFGFGRYHMPAGGRLLVYSPDLERSIRPFTAADNEDHGELWTPILRGDEAVLEVQVPVAALGELELELVRVLWGYAPFGRIASGSCNVDVVCPDGDAWRSEIRSVAVIGTGGGTFCTGFMVNNTAQDLTPYFMTAFHCGIRSSNAASLVVYWNYENSTCRPPGSSQSGGPGDGTLDQFQTGSILRAEYSPSDMTLVELDDAPDAAWNVHWAGWDATSNDFAGAIAIHHPNTDEKRISFEDQPTTTTSYLQDTVPGDGTHVRVDDWDVGTTEPGSSGSPLFSPARLVIGQLHGGFAACGNNDPDWYGRMSISWTGGGSAASRLVDWLDPGGTGQLTLPGTDQAPNFSLTVTPSSQDVCAGTNGVFDVAVGSILAFTDPVTLGATLTGATATPTPSVVNPPGTSAVTVTGTGALATGVHPLTVTGNSGALMHQASADLVVWSTTPAGAKASAPPNDAIDQPVDLTLSWAPVVDTAAYEVEIALDAGFTSIAEAGTTASPSYQATSLLGSTTYYWRVRATNGCGDGAWTTARSFTTEVLPGDCPQGLVPTPFFSDDLEAPGPWGTGGDGSTWTLAGGNVHSGVQAYAATDVPDISDQHLISPPVALPAAQGPLTLRFWQWQEIEDSSDGCYDGAVLEISTDDGASWTRLESEILVLPYDGLIDDGFDNPLANQNAWCGDPRDWTESIVDLDAFAGDTVRFRFRLATDLSLGRDGWVVDDIRVTGCAFGGQVFGDDFESGNLSSWSQTVP
ncbi:MAG: hypothetical protein AAGC60_08920 [Acidobacteriota bacterium]